MVLDGLFQYVVLRVHVILNISDSGSVGGVRPCQGRCRGFESRLSLFESLVNTRDFLFVAKILPRTMDRGSRFLQGRGRNGRSYVIW